MTPTAVVSRRGLDRIRAGHPWIYRSDVVSVSAEPGDLVRVLADRGRPAGWAFFSSDSQIALRFLSSQGSIDERTLIGERLQRAIAYRSTLGIDATACRLVHAEADLL